MILQLTLPPELEQRLALEASRNGKPVEQYAVQILDDHLPQMAKRHAASES